MERTFDTNYILNDIYDNSDGTVRVRRFDSNYIWNVIYDPTLPGIRIKDILGLLASSVEIDATQFDGLLNDTITDVQKLADFLDNLTISAYASAGLLTEPTYIDNNDGTITINSNTVSLWNNSTFIGFPKSYSVAQKLITPSENVTNYVVVNYNNGVPEYQVITNVELITESDVVPVITLFRNGNLLHNLNWDAFGTGLANKINQRLVKTERLKRETGFILTTVAGTGQDTLGYGDHIKVTGGYVWNGAKRQQMDDAVTSDVDTTTFLCYYNGASWTISTTPTGFINTQYWDSVSNTLKTLGNDKYVNNWIYRGVEDDKHIYILLGEEGQHTNPASAIAEPMPANIPQLISSHALLVGRIIAQEGTKTPYNTTSAFITSYGAATTTEHNDLVGIQGGIATQHNHLTNAELVNVQNIPTLQGYEKDPSGFVNPENVIVTYNATDGTITLIGTVIALWRGNVVPSLVTGWVSAPHPTGKTTNQYLYYDGTNFVWSDNVWTFDMLQIAVAVYYDSTVGFRGERECHGLMQWQCHLQEHFNEGTWLLSGGVSRGITLNNTTAALRRPTVDELTLMDEDLKTINPAILDYLYPHQWLTGSTLTGITNNHTIDNADIAKLNGNIPYYNPLVNNEYTLTAVPNNGYTSIWRVDIPATTDADSQKIRSIWVLGQTLNTGGSTVSNANALASQLASDPSSLNLGALATPEYRIGWQYVIRYSNLNWTVVGEQAISGSKQKPVQIQGIAGLTSVAHDDTLTGAGTIGNPLGVVGISLYDITPATGSTTIELNPNSTTNILTALTSDYTLIITPLSPSDFTYEYSSEILFQTSTTVPSITITAPSGVTFTNWNGLPTTWYPSRKYKFIFIWISSTRCDVDWRVI